VWLFFKLTIMPCLEDYIDCTDKKKNLTPGQLLKLLLAKITIGVKEKPAVRVCISNADEVGGACVNHYIATAGQTVFPLGGTNKIRKSFAWFRNGAIQHNTPAFAVGDVSVTLPAQAQGTEITIIS